MRIVLFFDQLQAGTGTKDDKKTQLSVEKGGIGSYGMFAQYLTDIGAHVACTIYCGSEYFHDNKPMVMDKIAGLLEKVKADVLLCGPCFNYTDYAQMAAELAENIQNRGGCRTLVVCSQENTDTIETYKNRITMVKMPKKGGVGLNDSLKMMAQVILAQESGKLGTVGEALY